MIKGAEGVPGRMERSRKAIRKNLFFFHALCVFFLFLSLICTCTYVTIDTLRIECTIVPNESMVEFTTFPMPADKKNTGPCLVGGGENTEE